MKFDVAIIGGGIAGISLGRELLIQNNKLKVVLVEKDSEIGKHASGRNSGVIHAGFYYGPDTLKARMCLEGNLLLKKFCQEKNIKVVNTGKVVVTTSDSQLQQLERLYERGLANAVPLEIHNEKELQYFEPLATTRGKFIFSPTTSITSPKQVINEMFNDFQRMGGAFYANLDLQLELRGGKVELVNFPHTVDYIINAAGAGAHEIAKSIEVATDFVLLPFMGLYLSTLHSNLPIRKLIYPVPDPAFPFLGTHLTLTHDGLTKIGPTAIPVLASDEYSFSGQVSSRQGINSALSLLRMLGYNTRETLNLALRELPQLNKSTLISKGATLVPHVGKVKDWERHPPGIRAQLINKKSGKTVDDFLVETLGNSIHLLNVMSPGWTTSLSLAKHVSNMILS
jgi:L-2-hydroxyglutarate oxidase LhgO